MEHTTLVSLEQYLARTFGVLATIFVGVFFVRFFIVDAVQISGRSMELTLLTGEVHYVNRVAYLFDSPARYDVVQFVDPETGTFFVKRVMGLPGETVSIRQNTVFLEGGADGPVELRHDFLSEDTLTNMKYGQENFITVPAGSYFMMGDNRPFSTDSRDFGSIPVAHIAGRLIGF